METAFQGIQGLGFRDLVLVLHLRLPEFRRISELCRDSGKTMEATA